MFYFSVTEPWDHTVRKEKNKQAFKNGLKRKIWNICLEKGKKKMFLNTFFPF